MPNTGMRPIAADRVDEVAERRRVARARDQEDAVGVAREQLLGGVVHGSSSSVTPRATKLRTIES
jgi:hypothetical protein